VKGGGGLEPFRRRARNGVGESECECERKGSIPCPCSLVCTACCIKGGAPLDASVLQLLPSMEPHVDIIAGSRGLGRMSQGGVLGMGG
jgi:hypothetical protein